MPRSAVKVIQSHSQTIQELHDSAAALEAQLAQNNKGDANKIRTPLCQILADFILTDSTAAYEHNACDRLWTTCFYARLAPLRLQLAKAKRKVSVDNNSKTKQLVQQLEESLQHFLAEATTLYMYLIDKLQDTLLLSAAQSSQSVTASTILGAATTTDHSVFTVADVCTVVSLPCLYRLRVHLGDLYRYATTNNKGASQRKAEHSYQMACRIGPGHGHAYNQLAVLSSQQSQPAIALYWYARSLLATAGPFATSHVNLERLLAAHVGTNNNLTNSTSTTNDSAPPSCPEFLRQFVMAHATFILVRDDNDTDSNDNSDTLVDLFRAVLSNLSESLVCKLVVIQAFSESVSDQARALTVSLATVLAERILDKPAVRLVGPLLLASEYLVKHTDGNDDESQKLLTCNFWKQMIAIWNTLQTTHAPAAVPIVGEELIEYCNLRGYAPFESFLEQPLQNGYVSEEQAMELIKAHCDKTGSTQPPAGGGASTASVGSTTSSASSSEQGRIKVARLLAFGERLANDEESEIGRHVVKTEGVWKWVDVDEPQNDHSVRMDSNDDNGNENSMMMMMDENDCHGDEPALVYTKDANGGAPLLVPAGLLNKSLTPVDKMEINNDTTQEPTLALFQQTPAQTPLLSLVHTETLKSPATLLPPPGFGSSTSNQLQQSSWHGLGALLPGFEAPATAQKPGSNDESYLFQSSFLFGNNDSLSTANPFASLENNYNPFPQTRVEDNLFLQDQTTLLDSSLLHSLLHDDGPVNTKNPFTM
jgi:hypothetical protein